MAQHHKLNQQNEQEEKPKINYNDLHRYLRATAERDLINLQYLVHGNTLTILLGNFESRDELERIFKNNYTALMSLIELENINVHLDMGFQTIPLTLGLLKELSGLSL